MTRVKICGITNIEDALVAANSGANAVGFVFTASPRRIDVKVACAIRKVLPDRICTVGVFVDEPATAVQQIRKVCHLDYVQIHGPITTRHVDLLGQGLIPVLTVNGGDIPGEVLDIQGKTVLLDAYHRDRNGGEVQPFEWSIARELGTTVNVLLAGGLNPSNITEALTTARPSAVDVSSGVESSPGVKDHAKIKAFIQRVRKWDSQTNADISANSVDDMFLKH